MDIDFVNNYCRDSFATIHWNLGVILKIFKSGNIISEGAFQSICKDTYQLILSGVAWAKKVVRPKYINNIKYKNCFVMFSKHNNININIDKAINPYMKMYKISIRCSVVANVFAISNTESRSVFFFMNMQQNYRIKPSLTHGRT